MQGIPKKLGMPNYLSDLPTVFDGTHSMAGPLAL